MSIEAGGAFSGKLESIDGLKLNNRAEIHINKYYQGIITLYMQIPAHLTTHSAKS